MGGGGLGRRLLPNVAVSTLRQACLISQRVHHGGHGLLVT